MASHLVNLDLVDLGRRTGQKHAEEIDRRIRHEHRSPKLRCCRRGSLLLPATKEAPSLLLCAVPP